MRILYVFLCCLLAGCTSSSRLANPLGLDLDPVLHLVDDRRPVPVIYPAGRPQTSLVDSYGPEWQVMPHGYPSLESQE